MNVYPVDSRQVMLKPQDIFAVAAHEYKPGLEAAKEAAQKAGVSPERMSYTIMLMEYSDPKLIRIRAGNTLFTIAALPNRLGFVRSYNGDIGPNFINNMVEFVYSARKIGFDTLFAYTSPQIVKAVKLAMRRDKEVTVEFDDSGRAIVVKTGPARD